MNLKPRPHTHALKWALVALSLSLAACSSLQKPEPSKGWLLFNEKCQTEAGIKIYKRVENVEGILLKNIRPHQSDTQWRDVNYPGAAFASEATEDEYIKTFLAPERGNGWGAKITPEKRGYINFPGPVNDGAETRKGYAYVDVVDQPTNVRYRYKIVGTQRKDAIPGFIDWILIKEKTTEPPPRYQVEFEDHVIPDERALGVASSTVKVIDTKSGEILGEMIRYAFGTGFNKISGQNSSPWLAARQCGFGKMYTVYASTRQFADQVLIPKQ